MKFLSTLPIFAIARASYVVDVASVEAAATTESCDTTLQEVTSTVHTTTAGEGSNQIIATTTTTAGEGNNQIIATTTTTTGDGNNQIVTTTESCETTLQEVTKIVSTQVQGYNIAKVTSTGAQVQEITKTVTETSTIEKTFSETVTQTATVTVVQTITVEGVCPTIESNVMNYAPPVAEAPSSPPVDVTDIPFDSGSPNAEVPSSPSSDVTEGVTPNASMVPTPEASTKTPPATTGELYPTFSSPVDSVTPTPEGGLYASQETQTVISSASKMFSSAAFVLTLAITF